jgi:hypothetical protein
MHKCPVPLAGGVGIIAAFCASVAAFAWDEYSAALALFAFLCGAYGVLDDKFALGVAQKLLFQAAIAVSAALFLARAEAFSFFGSEYSLGALSVPASAVWLVFMMNAVNLTDGIDGLAAGTSAVAKRAEAYEVLVLKKGETPEGYDATKAAFVSTPAGKVHVQKIGWTDRRGTSFGTTGKGRRVEALRLKLSGLPWDGKIVYQSYVQGIGWQGKKADGTLSGTSGKGKRIEAVRISLRGEAAEHLSVWYRVHSQKYGWLGWAKDGENAGTAKRSKRAESVQVQLLPKGAVPAGYDASVPAFKTK